ncbi:phenol 2-monooxygenase [Fusarium acutatum]|uniref:Phenol 2-monooxygenase n=1 Tax=Fusarium acutatum TaxID=78861 RepID=A0A8H4NE04_9HYPO|nr:phenol 2-monooxygenase [Fusarium acutatum]
MFRSFLIRLVPTAIVFIDFTMVADLYVDILIIGAGLNGLVVAKDPTTAYTPRAHGVNPFALECFRDIGLEDEALRLAIRGPSTLSMRFAKSFTGEEYGRVASFEEKPAVAGLLRQITPCEYVDLPQRHLEPLFGRYASHHNFYIRFSTELTHVESVKQGRGLETFLCTLRDHITHETLQVRTKYLFGADGARSVVSRSLGFEYRSNPVGIKACNVLLRVDLSRHMVKERQASLHWIANPGNRVFPGLFGHLRVVRPWEEWVLVAFGPGGSDPFEGLKMDDPKLAACVREMVGDESLNVEVLAIDHWSVRDSIATQYSKSDLNAFVLGDAAHRHPPTYGLGSNTCIQDAYNLAWKIAFVSKGLAGRSLLDTFSIERQPIGSTLVRESNAQLRASNDIWEALGMTASTPEEGNNQVAELPADSAAGRARREKLYQALETSRKQLEGLGLAYNHWYNSNAVYLADEPSPRPILKGDPIVEVQVLTYPGSRLPHVWLDTPTRGNMISSLDLAGGGAFCLITGVGGQAWRAAADVLRQTSGIPMRSYGIGVGLEFIDVYRDWHKVRGVEDDGVVLIRPDRFVAWRSIHVAQDCTEKLKHVLDTVLARDEL